MKIDQLLYFVQTAQQEHVGKAARILHVTPSAVSHAVRELESELGHKLFDRVGRRLALTETGKEFLVRAQALTQEISTLKADFLSPARSWEGSFRVAVANGLGAMLIPVWVKLKEKHPRIVLELLNRRTSEVLELTEKGTVDLGLCFNPVPHPRLEAKVLRVEPLALVVRHGHRAASLREPERLSRLREIAPALPRPLFGIDLAGIFPQLARRGLELPADFIFDTYEDAAAYVRLTDSWSLIPDALARRLGLANVSPKNWKARIAVKAVYMKGRRLHPIFHAILRRLERPR